MSKTWADRQVLCINSKYAIAERQGVMGNTANRQEQNCEGTVRGLAFLQ